MEKYRFLLKNKERNNLPLHYRVLKARGIKEEKFEEFLNPSVKKLISPFLMENMEKVVERIICALKEKEKIGIFSDYDADGITGSALLYRNLKNLGAYPVVYIPHRLKEGYGLSEKGLMGLKKRGASLVITVDCGIRAFKEAQLAKEIGLDLIITDHHEPESSLPECFSVINPKADSYPFKGLSGAGVSFKVIEGIYEKSKMDKTSLYWDLDLVTIGTVADQVPLLSENRIIVSNGLKIVERTKKAGVKSLKKVSGIKNRPVDTYDIGFILAPRLNASGRMEHAKYAFSLLISKDGKETLQLSYSLDKKNRMRQELEEIIFKEALMEIEKTHQEKEMVIVIGKKGWHEGIIGIVASKIVERFSKPTFIFSIHPEIAKGSCRSIASFPLMENLSLVQDILIEYGGHSMAAGLKIKPDKLETLRERLNEIARKKLKQEDLYPIIEIDCETNLNELKENYENLCLLEPFGESNPPPVFFIENIEILSEPKRLNNKFFSFYIGTKKNFIRTIVKDESLFNQNLSINDKINGVFEWKRNKFSKKKEGELILHAFKKSNRD